MSSLRPKPFRGDVVAAGVVVLATLVWTVVVRFAAWEDGVQLAVAVAAWGFVAAMAILAPLEGEAPRAYQSVLYVASIVLFVDVVAQLSFVLGSGALQSSGTATWALAAIAAYALGFAVRRNSAVCTLVGSLAAAGAVLAAVDWIFSPDGVPTFRWVLAALTVVFGVLAIGQRDRRPRHGVALIEVAGSAVLAIAGTFVAGIVFGDADVGTAPSAGWGWELLMLAAGFGLIAYSSVDRQPGPAYLGVLNLVAFTLLTLLDDSSPTFLGWPLVLALMAAFLLTIGLRPTTPAPPAPDVDAPEPPPLPLR
ncbi:MAG: hypothetical protein JWQ18_310 [Conexibacter sp.]|nr:hypothetical protein [Conexibacter sp.]